MSSLTRIVPWSQQLACEVLSPGDLAVDLTAGKGRDTLSLAHAVGPIGQVVALDLQAAALAQTAQLLESHGLTVNLWSSGLVLPRQPGIFLLQTCHGDISQHLQHPAKVIMANLGYLPGGGQIVVTQTDSTLSALQQSLGLLAPGGRLVVTVYPGHPGGCEEQAAVKGLLGDLTGDHWQVLSIHVANCSSAPELLIAERCF